jgi:DNA-binding winged helix-turn-helix (wHTH) protein
MWAADGIHLIGRKLEYTKKNRRFIETNKKDGLEVNTKVSIYSCLLTRLQDKIVTGLEH